MHVYGLDLGLARAYLLESQTGLVLVDAGSPGFEGRVLAALKTLGRQDLRLIFITHAHLDHFGSAAALRRCTGASIAIHKADALAMANGETHLGSVRGRGRLVQALMPLVRCFLRPEPTQPDHLLIDGQRLDAFGLDAVLLHTPGHTPGSSCLIAAQRYAFAGDLLSTNGRPHAQRYYADNWSLIPSSLDRLKALKPEKTYPGHGRAALDAQALQQLSFFT
jgi:glyoxylase-like metal-dependent hydrolase (beta-lactamase superfamily II)